MKPKWCVSYKNEIDLFKKCVGFWDENNIPRFSSFMVVLSKQFDVPYRKVIHFMQQGQDNEKQFTDLYSKWVPKRFQIHMI